MAQLDFDAYDIVDGKLVKAGYTEFIERKRSRIEEEIKRLKMQVILLEEQLEQTSTIQMP